MEPVKEVKERKKVKKPDIVLHKCFGCVEPNFKFTDDLSIQEYDISGLCQDCQDDVFGKVL